MTSARHRPHHRPHHRGVDRVVELLGAATTDPRGLTLTRLARAVDAPVSSVQKLAYGLVATGMLAERDGRYTVGPAAMVLAYRGGQPPIDRPNHDDLVRLHETSGAAALLTVRLGDSAVNVRTVGLSDSASYADARRWRHPLQATAAGRVLAAYLPEFARVAWVDDVSGDDQDAAMRLLDDLQEVRRRGAARGVGGPLRPDLESVAVPVWRDGEVRASVALAWPRGETRAVSSDELEAQLKREYPAPQAGVVVARARGR